MTITATPFNPALATLAQLREGRALILATIEAHNLDREKSLDREQLGRLRSQKGAIENAGRDRFGVRTWE